MRVCACTCAVAAAGRRDSSNDDDDDGSAAPGIVVGHVCKRGDQLYKQCLRCIRYFAVQLDQLGVTHGSL